MRYYPAALIDVFPSVAAALHWLGETEAEASAFAKATACDVPACVAAANGVGIWLVHYVAGREGVALRYGLLNFVVSEFDEAREIAASLVGEFPKRDVSVWACEVVTLH